MEPNVDRGMWSVVALLAAIVIGGVVLLAFPRISGKISGSMDETVDKAFKGDTPSWVSGDKGDKDKDKDKDVESKEYTEPIAIFTYDTSKAKEIYLPVSEVISDDIVIKVVEGDLTPSQLDKAKEGLIDDIGKSIEVDLLQDRVDLSGETDIFENSGRYSVIVKGRYRSTGGQNQRERKSLIDVPYINIKEIGITDMSKFFSGAKNFTGNKEMSTWDVSSVKSMSEMFNLAAAFNGDISGWDTSNVTDMNYMFSGAEEFNGDISGWDTSNVTDMRGMFSGAEKFNQDIGDWEVGSVKNMGYMFNRATAFNKDISKWVTSNVTDMDYMFNGATNFNHDISEWDTSKVEDMSGMFRNAVAFDQDISGWNVENVRDISSIFSGAKKMEKEENKNKQPIFNIN